MPERKYWAYRVRSTPDVIREQVRSFVVKNRLRDRIPSICHEQVRGRPGIKEFYFFLGTNDEEDEFSLEVLHHPGLNAILGHPAFSVPFDHDQIKTMVTREQDSAPNLESVDYVRQVHSYVPNPASPDNPFDFATFVARQAQVSEQQRQAYNCLLYWMSAKGTGTWQAFCEACATLRLNTFAEPRHIFRRLRLLGHAEYLDNGARWAICPACMVEAEQAHSTPYFLAGARVPHLIEQLRSSPAVSYIESLPNGDAPDTVWIHINDSSLPMDVIQTNEQGGRFAGRAAWKLAQALPDLNGWQCEVLKSVSVPTDRYEIHRWTGMDFDEWVNTPDRSGFYRLRDTMVGSDAAIRYLFCDVERDCWLQGDWYGLRFLGNWHMGLRAQLQYDASKYSLYVPDNYHVPDLYERALVLASGYLPEDTGSGLLYAAISQPLVEEIATKLYAELA